MKTKKGEILMISFHDIQEVLKTSSYKELVIDYTLRQKRNKRKNNDVIREVINELVDDANYIPLEDYSAKLQVIFSLLIASNNPKNREIVSHIIDTYNYRSQAELIVASQYIDSINTKDLDHQLFSLITNGLISIKSFKLLSDTEFLLDTKYGDIHITSAFTNLGIENIPPENRRGYCHNITTAFLLKHPNFYGAYFYIPLNFQGYFEHSVVIDPDNNLVYDLTNNATMDLTIWQKLYPHAFIISGQKLKELFSQVEDTYNIQINMSTIEEVRRIKRKNR